MEYLPGAAIAFHLIRNMAKVNSVERGDQSGIWVSPRPAWRRGEPTGLVPQRAGSLPKGRIDGEFGYNGCMLSVILVRPGNPENICLASRAMKNTGVRDLRLTGIRRIRVKAFAAGVHAADILESARLCPDPAAATADLQVVFAASARPRSNFPALSLDEAVERIRSYPAETRIGLLFGNERTGLTSEEMRHSNFRFTIPQAARQPSYNLAAAVLLTLYPLFAAGRPSPPVTIRESPLPRAAQEAAIGRVLAILEERGFVHETNRRHVADVVFELFGRLAMTANDRNLLLAVFHKGAAGGPSAKRWTEALPGKPAAGSDAARDFQTIRKETRSRG